MNKEEFDKKYRVVGGRIEIGDMAMYTLISYSITIYTIQTGLGAIEFNKSVNGWSKIVKKICKEDIKL